MLGREPGRPWDYHRRPHNASSVWPPDQPSNRAAAAPRSHNKKLIGRHEHTSSITVNPPQRQDEDAAAPLPPDVRDAREPSAPESGYARLIHEKADNDGHDSSSGRSSDNGEAFNGNIILYLSLTPYLNPRYHWYSLSCPVCPR